MPKLKLSRLAVLAGVAGLVLGIAVDAANVRAESPLEFLTRKLQRQQFRAPVYSREPVAVPRGGLFGRFFDFGRPEREPPPRRAAPVSLERVICRRQCDGAQFVFGIGPARSHKEAEAMCAAAGDDARTDLAVEKFVPGAGFDVPAPRRVASVEPLREGRAALDSGAVRSEHAAASSCPVDSTQGFLTIPIMHDATLKAGDVVATRDGFKMFVGKGHPPFRESDFVDIDQTKKRVASDIRKLKIADR